MWSRFAAVASMLVMAGPLAGTARADCNCLYDGQRYEQEETVCMRTPQGMRLARCAMLGNVAWWQVLDGPCAGAVSQLPADAAARMPSPPAGAAGRWAAASSR